MKTPMCRVCGESVFDHVYRASSASASRRFPRASPARNGWARWSCASSRRKRPLEHAPGIAPSRRAHPRRGFCGAVQRAISCPHARGRSRVPRRSSPRDSRGSRDLVARPSAGWRRRVALGATAAARGATKRRTTLPIFDSFPDAPASQVVVLRWRLRGLNRELVIRKGEDRSTSPVDQQFCNGHRFAQRGTVV